jgi:rSAM/selenodomain-associated transferase 1
MTRVARCLQVFAREPRPGAVKTRLIPGIGAEAAAAVYHRLLSSTLAAAAGAGAERRELWLDRPPRDPAFRQWVSGQVDVLRTQPAGDLGQRMHAAFVRGLARADAVVLIGSDCPTLDSGYVDAAFAQLRRHDAVLGPTVDGGYILIGLRQLDRGLFEDMPWSTPQVAETTRARLRQAGLAWSELAPQRDVDTPADLAHFPALLANLDQGAVSAPAAPRLSRLDYGSVTRQDP